MEDAIHDNSGKNETIQVRLLASSSGFVQRIPVEKGTTIEDFFDSQGIAPQESIIAVSSKTGDVYGPAKPATNDYILQEHDCITVTSKKSDGA